MLILLFGSVQASAEKPEVLNLFLSYYFFYAQQQKKVFKTQVLTQPDFENLQKIHFKPEKGHFWITLKGPVLQVKDQAVVLEQVKTCSIGNPILSRDFKLCIVCFQKYLKSMLNLLKKVLFP